MHLIHVNFKKFHLHSDEEIDRVSRTVLVHLMQPSTNCYKVSTKQNVQSHEGILNLMTLL